MGSSVVGGASVGVEVGESTREGEGGGENVATLTQYLHTNQETQWLVEHRNVHNSLRQAHPLVYREVGYYYCLLSYQLLCGGG